MTDGHPPLRTLRLPVAAGQEIAVDHLAGTDPAQQPWLFLHGLASVRSGQKSGALLRRCEQQGREFARFDFRGHGDSDGELGQITISEYVDDTKAALDLIGPATLFGSSLGGLVATFAAARHPEMVRALVLLSPAFGFLPRLEHRLRGDGQLETSEGRIFPISERVLDDARQLGEETLPERLPMPIYIAHGTADDVVPVELSQRFFAALPHARKQMWTIDGGDHRLADPIEEILAQAEAFLGPR